MSGSREHLFAFCLVDLKPSYAGVLFVFQGRTLELGVGPTFLSLLHTPQSPLFQSQCNSFFRISNAYILPSALSDDDMPSHRLCTDNIRQHSILPYLLQLIILHQLNYSYTQPTNPKEQRKRLLPTEKANTNTAITRLDLQR